MTTATSPAKTEPPRVMSSSSGRKRPRTDKDITQTQPTVHYNIPGMADLSEREKLQNELLSKRYQSSK